MTGSRHAEFEPPDPREQTRNSHMDVRTVHAIIASAIDPANNS